MIALDLGLADPAVVATIREHVAFFDNKSAKPNAEASSKPFGAKLAAKRARLVTMVPATARRDDQKRRMSAAAARPASRAPLGYAATTRPNSTLLSSNSALSPGYRGSRFAKSAPLVKNSAAVAVRARRSDIGRRDRSELRGSPTLWRVLTALNTGNHLVYLLVGRRSRT